MFCPIGGIIGSYTLDKFGRKRTFQTVLFLSLIAWGLVATASQSNKSNLFAQLIVSRCLVGMALGLNAASCIIYISEVSHVAIRGRVSMISSLAIALTFLSVYTMGHIWTVRRQPIN